MTVTRSCPKCGKEFRPSRFCTGRKTLYCSQRCKKNQKNAAARTTYAKATRTCEVCRTQFHRWKGRVWTLTCSPACSLALVRKRQRDKQKRYRLMKQDCRKAEPPPTRVCDSCRRPFAKWAKNWTLCCSPRCETKRKTAKEKARINALKLADPERHYATQEAKRDRHADRLAADPARRERALARAREYDRRKYARRKEIRMALDIAQFADLSAAL